MRKIAIRILLAVIVLYLLLLIPESDRDVIYDTEKSAFAWNSDQYWSELESKFIETKKIECDSLTGQINNSLKQIDSLTDFLQQNTLPPESSVYEHIEQTIFNTSVHLGACPDSLNKFIESFGNLRTVIKNQSVNWDFDNQKSRDRIYRLLYGGRTAIEEIILQSGDIDLPDVIIENDEPSVTPSAEVLGVEIHSGDILVSRGGAPTSALIARGNDYPGNFSHIAQVHINETNNEISIIESHIEIGVAVADVDSYFKDKKLRVMVLRPRSDLPSIQADPFLPHKAATHALRRARGEHIAYDFAMDINDPEKLFCSEVAYDAYKQYGLDLWSVLSHISSSGVRNWLADFGVENFTTMEPSDLEYDPQLIVVAEWRDYETLYKDHLDNAVVDIMLESAENGKQIEYDRYLLPFVRIMKGYSLILNLFDKAGPIPEGMSATGALKNEWFSNRHGETVEELKKGVTKFVNTNGYQPPYWELIKLARKIFSIYK